MIKQLAVCDRCGYEAPAVPVVRDSGKTFWCAPDGWLWLGLRGDDSKHICPACRTAFDQFMQTK